MAKVWHFQNEQEKALGSLERAFAKCKKANLVFQGMDGALLVFDADEYSKLTAADPIVMQQYLPDGNQGEEVNTYNCYKDSGGW